MKKILMRTGLALFLIIGMVSTASALPVIDFGTGGVGAGGSITFSGGNAVGVNIPVNNLLIIDAPSNNGSYNTSGVATGSSNDSDGSAALSFDTQANTISITGGVPLLSIPDGTVLLSGTFSSFSIDGFKLSGQGFDTKSALLLRAMGLPTDSVFFFDGFTIQVSATDPRAISTDFPNRQVPEPLTLLLLGVGLIGIGVSRRFK
jgi:hypothetical protein